MRGRLCALSVVIAVGLIMTRVIDLSNRSSGKPADHLEREWHALSHGAYALTIRCTVWHEGHRPRRSNTTTSRASPSAANRFQRRAGPRLDEQRPGMAEIYSIRLRRTSACEPGTPFNRNMTSHWQQPERERRIERRFGQPELPQVYFDALDVQRHDGSVGDGRRRKRQAHPAASTDTGAPNVGFTDTGPAGNNFYSIAGDGKVDDFTMNFSNPSMNASEMYNRLDAHPVGSRFR